MNRFIAIFLLSIFSACSIVTCYGVYKKGLQTSIAVLEEDENHLEILEVKKYLKSEENPFEIYEILEYKSEQTIEIPERKYEDVYLSSVETPPDFMC